MKTRVRHVEIFAIQLLIFGYLIAPLANAATLLDGKNITTAFYFPNTSTIGFGGVPVVSTVGSGVEIAGSPQGYPITSIDFSDTSIKLDFFVSLQGTVAAFNGWRFYDASDTISPFTSANLVTSLPGWAVGFDANNIWLNGSGATYYNGSTLRIDVGTVPLPAAAWLLGSGLLSLLAFARRRNGYPFAAT